METVKRTLTEEQKLKMKEGRERAAAEKLKADMETLAKLQKEVDKKMRKLNQKDIVIDTTISEDPTDETKDSAKSVKEEKPVKEKKPAKKEEPVAKEETVKEEKPVKEKKPAKKEEPVAKEETSVKVKTPVKQEEILVKDEKYTQPSVGLIPEHVISLNIMKIPVENNEDSDTEQNELLFMAKKKAIPKHVKTLVWNKYIGSDKAKASCLSCRQEEISIRSFHCGHVIAEAKGGDMTINNLRPICAACNGSMGTMSMNEFTNQFFGWSI